MEKHTIVRDGDPPLEFIGEEIGFASNRSKLNRWTQVTIYRTAAGMYVGRVDRMSSIGPTVVPTHTTAKPCSSVAELLKALAFSSNGKGGITRGALAEAARRDPKIREAITITVP